MNVIDPPPRALHSIRGVVYGPADVPHKFVNLGPGILKTVDIHVSSRREQVYPVAPEVGWRNPCQGASIPDVPRPKCHAPSGFPSLARTGNPAILPREPLRPSRSTNRAFPRLLRDPAPSRKSEEPGRSTPNALPVSGYLITTDAPVDDAVLNGIAHIPTEHLPKLVEPGFFKKLGDGDCLRIATWLAQKSFDEGGCPIGAVIIDLESRRILGKGHNTLGQENDSTTHGETAALRDAGRVARLRGEGPVDFRKSILFTSLTPCAVCCAQICHRCHFEAVVIGDITNAPSSEASLRAGGIGNVKVIEDARAVALYREYLEARPELHFLDWGGHGKLDEAIARGWVPVDGMPRTTVPQSPAPLKKEPMD